MNNLYESLIRLGTAPIVAIAGFYRPDLVLFGNPEMNEINLIKWASNGVSHFVDNPACLFVGWKLGSKSCCGFAGY